MGHLNAASVCDRLVRPMRNDVLHSGNTVSSSHINLNYSPTLAVYEGVCVCVFSQAFQCVKKEVHVVVLGRFDYNGTPCFRSISLGSFRVLTLFCPSCRLSAPFVGKEHFSPFLQVLWGLTFIALWIFTSGLFFYNFRSTGWDYTSFEDFETWF